MVLFVACQKFTSQASNVEDVLVKAALDATNDIHSITGTLHEVKHSVLHYDRQLYQTLNSTATKLDSIAVAVNEKTFVTKKIYQKVLTIVSVPLLPRFSAFLCSSPPAQFLHKSLKGCS